MSKISIAILCSLAFLSEVRAGFIAPEVYGTVGTLSQTINVVQPNTILPSTVVRLGLSDNTYGILEFRMSNFPVPQGGTWLQLDPVSLPSDAVVDLTVSPGDGQLTLGDFALGQPVLTYSPNFGSSNLHYIDVSSQVQQARAANYEFLKFILSIPIADRAVQFAGAGSNHPAGIVTDLPAEGVILTPPGVATPEPTGLALALIGLTSLACWGRGLRKSTGDGGREAEPNGA